MMRLRIHAPGAAGAGPGPPGTFFQWKICCLTPIDPNRSPRSPRAKWGRCRCSSARINVGLVSLDTVNCPGHLQHSSHRSCHASRAGHCERHVVGQPDTDHERLETLHPPPAFVVDQTARGGKVPKNKLLERVQKFATGEWLDLLRLSLEASEAANQCVRHHTC